MTETEPLSRSSLNSQHPTFLNLHFELFLSYSPYFFPLAVAVDEAPVRLLVVLLPGHALALPHRAPRHPQCCHRRPRRCSWRRRPLGRCQRRGHRFWNRQRRLPREARRTWRGHPRGRLHFLIFSLFVHASKTTSVVRPIIYIYLVILSGVYLRSSFGIGGRCRASLSASLARATRRHLRPDHRHRFRPLPDVPGERPGPHRRLVPLHYGTTRPGVQEGLRTKGSHGRTHLEVLRRWDNGSLETKVVQKLRGGREEDLREQEAAVALR